MNPLPAAGEVVVAPGRYRHYKGNDYEVVGMARHSESHDLLVVYRPLYGPQAGHGGEEPLWVRPAEMFVENVVVDGKTLPRFALLP